MYRAFLYLRENYFLLEECEETAGQFEGTDWSADVSYGVSVVASLFRRAAHIVMNNQHTLTVSVVGHFLSICDSYIRRAFLDLELKPF
jgi:hypothetical protein